jgi:hypothetical protein
VSAAHRADVRDDEQLSATARGVLVLAVVLCRLFMVFSFHIYDDAFITYRYAQNLAAGHGMVFNPGAAWEPVLGTTAPGYAVLLASCCALGAGVVHASLTINIVCDAAIAWMLTQLMRGRPLAATLAVLAFAAIPEVGRISVGGMEPPLFVALALGAVCAANAGRLALAGLLAALDCTVRPEAVLLVGVLALFYVRSWKQALSYFAPVAVVGGVVTALLCNVYGQPIPQSVRAKAGTHGLRPHLDRIADILARSFGPSLGMRVMVPLATLGYILAFAWKSRMRAFITFALLMVSAYLAAGVKTWGWYFYVPLVAWCAALGTGSDALLEFLGRARSALRFEVLGTRAVLALACVVVVVVALYSRRFPDRVTALVYQPLQKWVTGAGLEARHKTMVASDIGAIGFFSDTLILDSEGLVWPEAVFTKQVDVIRKHKPDYVMLVANKPRITPFVADPIAQDYRPIVRFNITGDAELRPDPATLPTWWEQDYIIYERIERP